MRTATITTDRHGIWLCPCRWSGNNLLVVTLGERHSVTHYWTGAGIGIQTDDLSKAIAVAQSLDNSPAWDRPLQYKHIKAAVDQAREAFDV